MMNQCRLWLGDLLLEAQPDWFSMFVWDKSLESVRVMMMMTMKTTMGNITAICLVGLRVAACKVLSL